MAHDATEQAILDDLQWVHGFPVGAGGVAPGGRAFRFNDGELNPWPFSTAEGLTWVRSERRVDHPGLMLGRRYQGTNGQWHHMGLVLKGFPMVLHIAVVADAQAAFAIARRAVQPTGSPALLRDWSPVLVHAGDTTRLALHFRAWDRNGEVQFRHQLIHGAGVSFVLDLLSNDLPLSMLTGERRSGDLLVRRPGGQVLSALDGTAHESRLEPTGWVLAAAS